MSRSGGLQVRGRDGRRGLRQGLGFGTLFLAGLAGAGRAEDAVFHDLLDLRQGLVLDLADAFLGDADDLADLFEGQWALGLLLPVEAAADHGLLDVRQRREVAVDDGLELIDALLLDRLAALVGPVALLEVGLELDREARAVPRGLHR